MKWLLTLWLVLQSYDEAMTRGVAAMEAGRFREAEAAFRQAKDLDPQQASPWLLLSHLLLDTGRPKLALEALDSVSDLTSQHGQVRCLKGRILTEMGRPKLAVEQLEPAVDALGGDATCREALGVAKLQSGDAEGALDAIGPLAEPLPEADRSPSLNATYGIALAQTGRQKSAIAPLRAALKQQPKRSRALFHLGRSLQSLERWEEAAETFEKGIGFPPPENIRFGLGLVRCQIRLGRLEEAQAHLERMVARHPKVGRAWLLRGVVAFEDKRYTDSVADMRKAIDNGYRVPESHLRLGMALGMTGRFDEAQGSLDEALSRDSGLATAYYYKGLFLFQEGEALAAGPGRENPYGIHALRLLERSQAMTPNPRTALVLSEAYLRVGQQMRALEAAAEALQTPRRYCQIELVTDRMVQ